MKQKRRRPEEWRRLLTDWRESGESAAGFASRIGVSAQTLYRWRAALEDTPPNTAGALAEIVEVRAAPSFADDRFDVRLAGGRSLGVPASFDEAALERLLRVLEATS